MSPAQIQGVRTALEPVRGQPPNPLQTYLDAAYERGRADQTRSAAECWKTLRALAESRGSN